MLPTNINSAQPNRNESPIKRKHNNLSNKKYNNFICDINKLKPQTKEYFATFKILSRG